jgi:microcystin-dependent protein
MSDQFIGEIRPFAGNFAPVGWAFCNGQLLPIQQNTALFSLLGVNYGGNGQTTFGLPNLQARFPLGQGQGPGLSDRSIGEAVGSASVTLQANQIPAHTHELRAAPSPTTGTASAAVALSPTAGGAPMYRAAGANQRALAASSVGAAGSSQPHENRQPYLAVNFIIALQGIFPPRS